MLVRVLLPPDRSRAGSEIQTLFGRFVVRIMLQPRTVSWALLLVTLAVFAPVRISAFVVDALDPSDPVPRWLVVAGVLAIVTLFVLHLAIALPQKLPLGERRALIAQAVLTFAPYLVLGRSWGPIAGLLAASTLLTMERSRGWVVFGAVVTFDAALRTWGPFGIARAGRMAPAEATLADVSSVEPWLAFGSRSLAILIFGLLLFGLTRLAQLTQQVHIAREGLAAIEVSRYRQQVASGLFAAVGDHLEVIVGSARRGMGESSERQRESLRDMAAHARQAMAAVRLGVDARPPVGSTVGSGPGSAADVGAPAAADLASAPTPDLEGVAALAERVLALTIAAYCLSFLVNLAGDGMTGSASWILAGTSALLAGVFGLRHLRPDRGLRGPRFVRATLPLQLLATFAAVAVFELQALPLVNLAAGAVLVRLRLASSLLVIVAGLVALPVLVPMAGGADGWYVYRLALVVAAAVALYALYRIPAIAQHLQSTRQDAARVAVALDRSRVGRDVHDLLGFGLSAISLRAEVAVRRSDSGAGVADEVFEELITLADRALDDLRSLAIDEAELDLGRELAGAAALLESAGIAARLHLDDADLPPPVDALFAVVVREAVTNVLRHANASTVDIVMSAPGREVRLVVRNDGVRHSMRDEAARWPRGRGGGIENLTARVSILGGQLSSGEHGTGSFELMVRVPIAKHRHDRPTP